MDQGRVVGKTMKLTLAKSGTQSCKQPISAQRYIPFFGKDGISLMRGTGFLLHSDVDLNQRLPRISCGECEKDPRLVKDAMAENLHYASKKKHEELVFRERL